MAEVLFFIAGIGAVVGAVATVSLRSPFYAVLALVVHLLSLAVLFLLLNAEFVAAAQVVVYAGAVMVLYVFVVAYVGGERESLVIGGHVGRGQRLLAYAFGLALIIEISIALLGSSLQAIDTEGAALAEPGFGSPAAIGALLLTRFLLPFELASFLLLIAAVGAVTLARRRVGIPGAETDPTAPARIAPMPAGTGSMAEAVAGLPPADEDRGAAGASDDTQYTGSSVGRPTEDVRGR